MVNSFDELCTTPCISQTQVPLPQKCPWGLHQFPFQCKINSLKIPCTFLACNIHWNSLKYIFLNLSSRCEPPCGRQSILLVPPQWRRHHGRSGPSRNEPLLGIVGRGRLCGGRPTGLVAQVTSSGCWAPGNSTRSLWTGRVNFKQTVKSNFFFYLHEIEWFDSGSLCLHSECESYSDKGVYPRVD